MEVTKDFSHERVRRHSSVPASELKQQLKRASKRCTDCLPDSNLNETFSLAVSLDSLPETAISLPPAMPTVPRYHSPPSSPRRTTESTRSATSADFLRPPASLNSLPPDNPIDAPAPAALDAFRTPPTSPSRRTATTSMETPSLVHSAGDAPSVSDEASIELPLASPASRYGSVGRGNSPAERKALKEGRIHKLLRRITSPHPHPDK